MIHFAPTSLKADPFAPMSQAAPKFTFGFDTENDQDRDLITALFLLADVGEDPDALSEIRLHISDFYTTPKPCVDILQRSCGRLDHNAFSQPLFCTGKKGPHPDCFLARNIWLNSNDPEHPTLIERHHHDFMLEAFRVVSVRGMGAFMHGESDEIRLLEDQCFVVRPGVVHGFKMYQGEVCIQAIVVAVMHKMKDDVHFPK